MLDTTPDLSNLDKQLSVLLASDSSNQLEPHFSVLKRLLLQYPLLHCNCQALVKDFNSLFLDDYWLKLEVLAQDILQEDDALFRRCLFNIASAIKNSKSRPSTVLVFKKNIDLLHFYRMNFKLGKELHHAVMLWDTNSTLARSTTHAVAQMAAQCLKILCDDSSVAEALVEEGILWFKSTMHFRQVLNQYPVKSKQKSALFYLLQAYKPEKFELTLLSINEKKVDVTDLQETAPLLVQQLKRLADSPKFKGALEHDIASMTLRFLAVIHSIRTVAKEHNEAFTNMGLDSFRVENFSLLKAAKNTLSKYQFPELILILEQHYGIEIHRHYYVDNLLSFYFENQKKYRLIDYSEVAETCPSIMPELHNLHQSETELLPEKNYGMETLHTRFSKIKNLILYYIVVEYNSELTIHGLNCLSVQNNKIQKAIFQHIQTKVKSKKMSVKGATSLIEVIRWLMSVTGQQVVESFKISYKRHQKHARRLKLEDLYNDDELRELIFYIEKGIEEISNEKQLLALYFARIQVKSCWNTSPMTDIELNDITDVELPTSKKSMTLLIQKPRKGYDIDTYSLDGRTVNSVMRDIVYVRDKLTESYRNLGDDHTIKYLFIFKEKTNVSRVKAGNIISHIKTILNRLGCTVSYNSMRIRKSGVNHLYLEVAKQMRAYESVKLHTFETFINHYQRISEQKTHETLHKAVDVMQRYFTGRKIDPEIKILMVEDFSTQKTPTGECVSKGNDLEATLYNKDHRSLSSSKNNAWCSDFLACVWCKNFRTVADPEHVWQLLSYRDYVLSDMSASISDIENNEFQQEAIKTLHQRVDEILAQVAKKSVFAVSKGKELMAQNGMHPFWAFAVTSVKSIGDIS